MCIFASFYELADVFFLFFGFILWLLLNIIATGRTNESTLCVQHVCYLERIHSTAANVIEMLGVHREPPRRRIVVLQNLYFVLSKLCWTHTSREILLYLILINEYVCWRNEYHKCPFSHISHTLVGTYARLAQSSNFEMKDEFKR